jgi:inhibitor of cysteine peptidase
MSSCKQRQWFASAILVLIMLGTALAAAGCGSKADAATGPMKLTEADNGRTITIKVGDDFQVILGGNPTTGYTWSTSLTDADKAILQQQGDPVFAQQTADSSIVGSGGTFIFTFKAAAAGQVTLKCGYARPWESVPPLQTFSVTVIVK